MKNNKEFESKFVEKVIESLRNHPESFTSRWYRSGEIQNSVKNKDNGILIMVNNGQITDPLEPKMTYWQRREARRLIKPIVEAECKDLMENFFGKD